MKYYVLASGSKGNSTVIVHGDTKIVIDCGTTKKYLKNAFEEIDIDPQEIDALLVTHSHSDHISQLSMFKEIETYSMQPLDVDVLHSVVPFECFQIKDLEITVLPLSHDCKDTIGFLVKSSEESLVYITDTGYVKSEVQEYIREADYYVFESNHDVEMLMDTNRPIFIKQRIIGDNGHLCNEDCAIILSDVIGENTKEIVLAHLSEQGNSEDVALDVVNEQLQKNKKDYATLSVSAARQFEVYKGGR